MAGDCGLTCPVNGGFFSHSPSVGGSVVLLTAFALLVPITFILGYRFRTPGFAAILATGLLLEVLGFAGRVLLHSARNDQGYFTLMLLGTVLGPSFMSSAIYLIIPHLLAVYGEGFSPCRPMLATFFLNGLVAIGLVIQVVGVVFVAYGIGGTSRLHSADIIAGGIGVQAVSLLITSGIYFAFVLRLASGKDVQDPKHSNVYLSSRFSIFLRCFEAATVLLLGYSIYRIIELAGGIGGDLFQSEAAFMIVDGAVPLVSCLLLTMVHPGAVFGSAWSATSPRRLKRRIPPALNQEMGYSVHQRYDPNIRKQFSPSTQNPLRMSSPPELAYGSYGLPATPRPTGKPPSPMIPSPRSAWTANSRRMSDKSDKRTTPKDLVDSDALW